jgi:hypothetical protein
MKKDLAIWALDMAARLRNPPPRRIFHSDRGRRSNESLVAALLHP